jgi:hypothetical protein
MRSRLLIVPDAREQPAQLDRGRQLAALIEGGSDRGGLSLGDDEHQRSMGQLDGGRQAGPTRCGWPDIASTGRSVMVVAR